MEFEPLTALDEAVFQRVWNRVMPDQSLSPVVVRPTAVAQPPAPDYIAQLEEVMDGVRQWQSRLSVLARQNGGKSSLRTLCEGEGRQMKQLDGLYFLLTGRRYLTRRAKPWESEGTADSLRRGFYLEMDWVAFYENLATQQHNPGLQEAIFALREGALEQGRRMRGMV